MKCSKQTYKGLADLVLGVSMSCKGGTKLGVIATQMMECDLVMMAKNLEGETFRGHAENEFGVFDGNCVSGEIEVK